MTTVLIANRGEIALRVLRAVRTLGWRAVAVHAPADRDTAAVRLADHRVELTGERPYLDAAELVEAARGTGCDLVHPGYGFLAESADLAARCAAAGVGFAGPTAATLARLGDKVAARGLATGLDVPVLRATEPGVDLAAARAFLASLGEGRGVMVKAVAGGGGRGMRRVTDPAGLDEAMERCRGEAVRAFGDEQVFLEELLPRARHLEVQVVGDGTGAVSHVGDRECSLQRRHQKVVEIAPAVTVPDEHRAPLRDAAARMLAAVEYAGLGTVEFLVDADAPERFAFLEVNPRVQVEHTVTEEVTGLDLVVAQLRIAGGATLADLGLTQPEVPAPRGVALQARVNLERLHPDGTAHATAGEITDLTLPGGPGVRVDTAARAGQVATATYDSLLAKVVVHRPEPDLAAACAAADAALAETVVEGPGTTLAFLRALLAREDVRRGAITTTYVDDHLAELVPEPAPSRDGADPGTLTAASAASVVAVPQVGDRVRVGEAVVVLEAMKMEHVVAASVHGEVRAVHVAVGDVVDPGRALVDLTADADQSGARAAGGEPDPEHIRPDLAEAVERHRVGLDEARPDAVAKRRRTGQRTARENVADLCDDGSFTEYGALVIAAQRGRRSLDDLIASTPADGLVSGIGTVNAATADGDARCVVMSYDYTVLAGTQGFANHEKTDRMLELAERQRLPLVLFAEGGGGRPGDTDVVTAGGLDLGTFAAMGRLNGLVPTVGIASGRCFAGNAALLGCCDVVIATRDATIGMGGPAMIEGGGLGSFPPEEVGPVEVQRSNGVIDLLAADEEEAVGLARRYLSYFQGPREEWTAPDQRRLRHVVPENRVRVYDVRRAVDLLADDDSVLELRRGFGDGMITALVRVEGRPMGLLANNPEHLGGAIDADAADKAARFLQLCDAHRLPVISLVDTPGFMVGPESERTATVRHFSRMFVAGGHLSVPLVGVILRKGYGLGAMAMVGGGFHVPDAMLAWPSGEVGGMGLEGAVRLGYRRELDAIDDPDERQQAFDALLAEAYDRGKAVAAASVFEFDDVVDPAATRDWITRTMPRVTADRTARRRIDTW